MNSNQLEISSKWTQQKQNKKIMHKQEITTQKIHMKWMWSKPKRKSTHKHITRISSAEGISFWNYVRAKPSEWESWILNRVTSGVWILEQRKCFHPILWNRWFGWKSPTKPLQSESTHSHDITNPMSFSFRQSSIFNFARLLVFVFIPEQMIQY